MARLPSFIRRIDTAHGVRYEARINATLSGSRRLQNWKRFKTVDAAKDCDRYTHCAVRCDGEAGGRCVAHSQGDTGETAKMLFDAGSSAEEIAASLRCSTRTVYRALAVAAA